MRYSLLFSLITFILFLYKPAVSQDIPVAPKQVITGVFKGISQPLRDIPPISREEILIMEEKAKKKGKNTPWEKPTYPFAATALPQGPDPVWQKSGGVKSSGSRAPLLNFEGQTSPYYPPDCNGATGPSHYMQTINTTYAIYDKAGTLVAGPTAMNTLFGNVTGANYNDGDPIILYDEQANRFLAVEFSISGTNDYMLLAVSTTSDPTGTWYQYSFDVVDMPDYEKMAVWPDGYYMGTNTQPTTGNDIYVFERDQMLIGGTARMVAFDNPYRPGTGVVVVPPVDNDGPAAPAGAPGTFIAFNDDGISGGSDQLWLYELDVDWSNIANSTFNRTQQLNVQPFDSQFNNWEDIDQPGTTRNLCAISTVIMNVPQYRNFGTYQSIVCCHTVDVDGTNHAGVRWYELRKTPPSTTWAIRQQGTYAPDSHSRWMGAIAMNGSNKIALGYSISSSTEYPGIRYAGQSSAGYSSSSGVLDIPEEIALSGSNYQTTYNRWGDYASMSVDPSDDQKFWFTTEYIGSSEARKTKIISFFIGDNPLVSTLAATSVTGTTATINGTVNPNGLSTSYHFEWGTTVSYGNSTSVLSAGSGTSAVHVNENLTALTTGTTYHYRLVAVNSDGTTNGNDRTFIPGGAVLTTSTPSSITQSSANSGGNVTSDGGYSVTSRGVCWSTSANPTITGNHTNDGSGTGVFTSSITGLNASTTYHVRAYATNINGTFYGEDMTFTTLCGISSLPFNESFAGTSTPNCWSTQITGSGGTDKWAVSLTNSAGGTANEMKSTWQSVNPGVSRLITSPLNTLGISQLNLVFKHYVDGYATGTTLRVQSSIDKLTWTNETWSLAVTSGNVGPATVNTTISNNLNSSSTYIAFVLEGDLYQYDYWYIDDISITSAGPSLTVSPSLRSVAYSAGSTTFSVATTTSWTAVSDQSWCTVTPSGTGNGTISANFPENNSGSQRQANITVSASGATPVVVSVSQGFQPTLSVTPSTQAVTNLLGTTSFNISSNSNWTATSDETWCTLSPQSGTGPSTLTANYSENTSIVERLATITVTVSGLTPVVVTVSQAPGAPNLSVTPTSKDVGYLTGTTNFNVTTNSEWTAESDQLWCTVTPAGVGNGILTATYTTNTLLEQRIANITVTVPGLPPVVVTINQSGAPPPEFQYTIANDIQTSDRKLEFDLYLLNPQYLTLFELAIIQAGILVNSEINNGGSITASIVPGSSELVALQEPMAITYTNGSTFGCIKIAGRIGPGCTNGTIIGTTGLGTRICRVRITNTVPFAPSSRASLAFNFTISPYPTKVFKYSGTPCIGVELACNATNCFSLASNPLLNGPPSLAISPLNQQAGPLAGTTSYAVTSTIGWTAVSSQSWCTVTPSGFGNGTIVANYSQNPTSNSRIAEITVTASGMVPIVVTLNQEGMVMRSVSLSLFLQGLYTGSNTMHPAMNASGYHWGPTIADILTVELHEGTNYTNILYSLPDVALSTTGEAVIQIPASYSGNYYVTIRNRNHILTVSAIPISFSEPVVNYLFDLPVKAYGNNLALMIDGNYVFYAGDVTQDGLVDGSDLSMIGNQNDVFATGYLVEDVNGDGLVDGSDLAIAGNNNDSFVSSYTP